MDPRTEAPTHAPIGVFDSGVGGLTVSRAGVVRLAKRFLGPEVSTVSGLETGTIDLPAGFPRRTLTHEEITA